MLKQQPQLLGGGVLLLGLLVVLACGGGTVGTAAPGPQQPAQAAQPVPAAPAPEPAAETPTAPTLAPALQPPPPARREPAGEPRYGGILRLANRQDPPAAWDPMQSAAFDIAFIGNTIYGSGNLVKACRDNVYEICPGLAESWEHNSEFTQWTFKIRNSARWHDGKPFTAEDAKFWVELFFFGAKGGGKTRLPAYYKETWGGIQRVEAVDGNRLQITLSTSSPQYLYAISNPQQVVAHPRHLMQPLIQKGEVNVAPQDIGWVAMGPFKMVGYDKGSRVQVRRNETYWEKDRDGRQLPYLEGIDFAILRDPSAVDAAFRVGRLDGGSRGGGGHYLTKVRQAGYLRDLSDRVWFAEIGGNGGSTYGFNVFKSGPWQDLRVRKAISLWIDKRSHVESVYGGFGQLFTLLNPKNPFTTPSFLDWPGWNAASRERDRAEARRLLSEAGYPNGFPVQWFGPNRFRDDGEFLFGQLATLGIKVRLDLVDEATWSAGEISADYESRVGGTSDGAIPEAAAIRLSPFSQSRYPAPKYEDPKVTEYFRTIAATSDLRKRVQLWRELEQYYLLEKVYSVPLSSQISVVPFRTHVKGLPVPAEGVAQNLDMATVWLEN